MEHNMDTEQNIPLDNSENNDILLGPLESTTVQNIVCNKPRHPCDPEPKCPTTPCDPSTVRLQCCSRGVFFKLSCTKLPPDCDHPEARYDCELVDEGEDIDYRILSACDLKCERIEAIHSDHPIVIEDDTEVVHFQKLHPIFDDNSLDDSDIKNNFSTENSLLNDNNEGHENNLESLISSDDNNEQPFNQAKVNNNRHDHVDCNYIKTEVYFNAYDENEKNPDRDSKSPPEPTSSLPLGTPICHNVISDLLENNKIIYACRSKSKTDQVENITEPNESVKFTNIKNDQLTTRENKIYKCVVPNDSPEKDSRKSCTRESLVDQFAASFVEHHNKTVKIIKVAANDLMCLITNSSKDNENDSNYINTIIEYTRDTIGAVCTHTNKLINFDEECEDDEPKISKTQNGPIQHTVVELANDLIKCARDDKDDIDVINNKHDNLIVENAISIKESSQGSPSHAKESQTAKLISNEHELTDILTSIDDEVKNKVTEDILNNISSHQILHSEKLDFESDEYNDDSDESVNISNIFRTLKDKIRAVFNDHNNSDSTSDSSSITKFSEDSDEDKIPKSVH